MARRRFSSTVSSSITPRPSGTCATPHARDGLDANGPRAHPRRTDTDPPSGFTSPEIVRSRVVLPAPFAPSTAVIASRLGVEGDRAQRVHGSVGHGEIADLKHGAVRPGRRGQLPRPRRPGRRSRRRDRPGWRRGCRRAMTIPKFSTTIRSHTDMTRSMWCSTRSTAIVAVRPRMREPSEPISLSDSPLAGSSSSNSCGSAINARGQRGLLLHGIGQGGRKPVRVRRDPELVKDLHRPRRGSALFLARAPQPENGGDQVAVQYRLGAEHHVLADGQPGAQPDSPAGCGQCRVWPGRAGGAVADRDRGRRGGRRSGGRTRR